MKTANEEVMKTASLMKFVTEHAINSFFQLFIFKNEMI